MSIRPQIYKFLLIYPNLFCIITKKEYFCKMKNVMQQDNSIKRIMRLIAIGIVVITFFIWWRTPFFFDNWDKQTIYIGIIDTWYGNSNDSRAHAMWIDDDCGEGIYKVNQISNEIGIKPVFAIIPERIPMHLVDSLILWQNNGAGIVLHGLKHERWKEWSEQRIANDIEHSYEKLHELGFDTAKILKIIVPPYACNTIAIRKVIRKKGYQMVTGASLVNPDRSVFQLGRIGITPDTDTTKIRVLLQKAYQQNNFVIFGTHSSLPSAFSEEKTIKVLKMAKEIGFDFDFNH